MHLWSHSSGLIDKLGMVHFIYIEGLQVIISK